MVRWGVLAGCAAVVAGAAFVAGSTKPVGPTKLPPLPGEPAKAEPAKVVVVGQKTGYFNMAKVMRDYSRAKTAVERLTARKNRLAANLTGVRGMYADLAAVHKKTDDPKKKAELEGDLRMLARRAEDMDRDINKILNNQATIIISELYDEIRAVVTAVAHDNGLVAVLAYPDAVTPEEMESPMIKELKLKPPAAQPFYLDPSVDYSDEILRRLNVRFALDGGD